MEIKSRDYLSPLQWLAKSVPWLFARVSVRNGILFVVGLAVVALAFYAGGKPKIRQPVIQFAKPIVTLDFSRVDKFIKGSFASPRKIQIDIKHTHYQKLRFKREEAIRLNSIVTTEDSYVPARVTVDDQSYRVSMRLKGDRVDHLSGDKWSYRIEVKGDDAIWGMKRFSIQSPERSGRLHEWIMYKWFEYEDLIALRYEFVDVTINGQHLGVFTLEESFAKELIEHNRRTEGPILKFDENLLMGGRQTNRGDRQSEADVLYAADITSFGTGKTMRTEKLRENFLAGRAMLNQLRSRQKSLSEVLDVQRAARTFAIADFLGTYHAIRWKNVRFYFNPVTARMELIAYNMYGSRPDLPPIRKIAYQHWLDGKGFAVHSVPDWLDVFFSDEEFRTEYLRTVSRMASRGYLERFFESIAADLETATHILYGDGYTELTPVRHYLRNRNLVYELLHPKLPMKAYLKSFDVQSGQLALTVANTSFLPTQIEALECGSLGKDYERIEPNHIAQKTAGDPLTFVEITVGGMEPGDDACLQEVELTDDKSVIKELRLRYKTLGSDESRRTSVDANSVEIAWDIFPRSPSGLETLTASAPDGMIRIDEDAHEITIEPGHWMLTQDLVFPSGYRVIAGAGTTIVLNEGAALISFSPLRFTGSADRPVVVRSDDGSGQGVAVFGASERSELSHVVVTENLAISRGFWTLTGTVTFYESEVSLDNVHFEDNKAEDMANLIRSDYTIRDSRFTGSGFDSLDVDFGNGVLERVFFGNCGNDCIDMSGSNSTISAVIVEGAGDKGMSVGEQSVVTIKDSRISGTNFGLASKDNSSTTIERSIIRDTVTGLAAYQKKPEFSGASLKAMDVSIENAENLYFVDEGSTIVHDGKTINGNSTDVALVP